MTPDGERLAFLQNLSPSSKIRVLHVDTIVLAVNDFFTDKECNRYVQLSTDEQTAADNDDTPQRVRSKTVGKDDLAKAQPRRPPPTQTEPSLGGQRLITLFIYLTDIVTNVGGTTAFRDLGSSTPSFTNSNKKDDAATDGKYLKTVPQKGSTLVFFPAAGGIPGSPIDVRTLHAG